MASFSLIRPFSVGAINILRAYNAIHPSNFQTLNNSLGPGMEWPTSPPHPSLKQKIRSVTSFSCCFRCVKSGEEGRAAAASLIRSSSTWIRSKATEQLPELKERYQAMMVRMGKSSRRGYGEFRYDPLSYALNFDEGAGDDSSVDPEDFRHRNFSSRLPASPPQPLTGVPYR